MNINNHWRNKQLNDNLLWQEIHCLNFLKRHPTVSWQWHGYQDYFFKFCQQEFKFDVNNTGIVIINTPARVSPGEFVKKINALTANKPSAVYLAINRYEFRPVNDLSLDYPDKIEDCIDLIVSTCNCKFQRLYQPDVVDGKHFVGMHGLDVFVYEHY